MGQKTKFIIKDEDFTELINIISLVDFTNYLDLKHDKCTEGKIHYLVIFQNSIQLYNALCNKKFYYVNKETGNVEVFQVKNANFNNVKTYTFDEIDNIHSRLLKILELKDKFTSSFLNSRFTVYSKKDLLEVYKWIYGMIKKYKKVFIGISYTTEYVKEKIDELKDEDFKFKRFNSDCVNIQQLLELSIEQYSEE